MMTTPYTQALRAVRRRWEEFDLYQHREALFYYAFFCANIKRYLPHVQDGRLPTLFREVGMRQRMSLLDESHPDAMKILTIRHNEPGWLRRLMAEPGMICTFHTGSYRLIARLLAQHGIPLALVLSTDVLAAQGQRLAALHRQLGAQPAALEMIDAEQPNAVFSILRAARKGCCILAYIDGNTGVRSDRRPANTVTVDFLTGRLKVRQGIATIAHVAGLPIYPVVCTRPQPREIEFQWTPPIWADGQTDRDTYSRDTTRQLYRLLERTVAKNPVEWEGWLYLHTQFNDAGNTARPIEAQASEKLRQLVPFEWAGRHYLVDTGRYMVHPVPAAQYQTLVAFNRSRPA